MRFEHVILHNALVKKNILIGAGLSFFVALPPVLAEFSYGVTSQRSSVNFLIHENEDKRPSKDFVSKGSSNNLRLAASLKKLAPAGWKARVVHDGEADTSCRLSWSGGDSWVDILDDLLPETGLQATLDWKSKIMILKPAGNGICVELNEVVPAQEAGYMSSFAASWIINKGERLSEGLRRSASKYGWNLQWNLNYDFPVDADIPLMGDVPTMMRTLVRAYQSEGEMIGVTPMVNEINKVIDFSIRNMATPTDRASTQLDASQVKRMPDLDAKPLASPPSVRHNENKPIHETPLDRRYDSNYTYTP